MSIGVDERDEQDAEPPGLSPESAGVALECVGMVSEADSCAGGGVLAVPLSASASGACRSMGVGRKVISMMWGLGEWQGQKKRAQVQPLLTGLASLTSVNCPYARVAPVFQPGHNTGFRQILHRRKPIALCNSRKFVKRYNGLS